MAKRLSATRIGQLAKEDRALIVQCQLKRTMQPDLVNEAAALPLGSAVPTVAKTQRRCLMQRQTEAPDNFAMQAAAPT
jgi:hypothetical protein